MKTQFVLETADARELLALAEHAAEEIGVPQNIAICDAAGALLAFIRMDDAKPFTIDFAIAKARTAAGTRSSTQALSAIAVPGERGFGLHTLQGGAVAILPGGQPIVVDGQVVGGIGVSSGGVAEDAAVADRAIEQFAEKQRRSAAPNG